MSDFSFFELGIGLVVVTINGLIAKLVAGIWLPDDKARIAAFAFTLGSIGAARGYTYGLTVGALCGAIALWWLLFRREKIVA